MSSGKSVLIFSYTMDVNIWSNISEIVSQVKGGFGYGLAMETQDSMIGFGRTRNSVGITDRLSLYVCSFYNILTIVLVRL